MDNLSKEIPKSQARTSLRWHFYAGRNYTLVALSLIYCLSSQPSLDMRFRRRITADKWLVSVRSGVARPKTEECRKSACFFPFAFGFVWFPAERRKPGRKEEELRGGVGCSGTQSDTPDDGRRSEIWTLRCISAHK
jgi:hypothetical protein